VSDQANLAIDGVDALAEIEKYVRSKIEFSRSYPDASRIFATDIWAATPISLRS